MSIQLSMRFSMTVLCLSLCVCLSEDSDYRLHCVHTEGISSTLCSLKSFDLTLYERLSEGDTLLFAHIFLPTTQDWSRPQLFSCLLDVKSGERQREGTVSDGRAFPTDRTCKLVVDGLWCWSAVWLMLGNVGWSSICTSKVGLQYLGAAQFDSSKAFRCWHVSWMLS